MGKRSRRGRAATAGRRRPPTPSADPRGRRPTPAPRPHAGDADAADAAGRPAAPPAAATAACARSRLPRRGGRLPAAASTAGSCSPARSRARRTGSSARTGRTPTTSSTSSARGRSSSTHAGVADSPLLAKLRDAEAAAKDLAAREKTLAKEPRAADDLRRQLETAKRRREEADAERDDAGARADRAERRARAAEQRAADAEERLPSATPPQAAERRAAEPRPTSASPRCTDELEAVRAHREELLVQVEELRDAAARDAAHDRAALARCSAESGRRRPRPSAAAEDATRPSTVARGRRARRRATPQHLVFTDAARESAADSPYRRPAEILDALRKLDELAGRYAGGGDGRLAGAGRAPSSG